jgi:hypothetical protein
MCRLGDDQEDEELIIVIDTVARRPLGGRPGVAGES